MARPRIYTDEQIAKLIAWRQGTPRRSWAFIARRLGSSLSTPRYQYNQAMQRLQQQNGGAP